jgi:hypothetical protein
VIKQLQKRKIRNYRSHAPAWEFIRQRSSVAGRDAEASLTAFPRWSVTAVKLRIFFLAANLQNRQNMNRLSVGAGHARDILTGYAESEAPHSRAWPAPTSLNLTAVALERGNDAKVKNG